MSGAAAVRYGHSLVGGSSRLLVLSYCPTTPPGLSSKGARCIIHWDSASRLLRGSAGAWSGLGVHFASLTKWVRGGSLLLPRAGGAASRPAQLHWHPFMAQDLSKANTVVHLVASQGCVGSGHLGWFALVALPGEAVGPTCLSCCEGPTQHGIETTASALLLFRYNPPLRNVVRHGLIKISRWLHGQF